MTRSMDSLDRCMVSLARCMVSLDRCMDSLDRCKVRLFMFGPAKSMAGLIMSIMT